MKTDLMVVSVSSTDKDAEKTFNSFNRMLKSVRIMLAIVAFYEIWQMDVKTAFLNGFIKEELYMTQPEGFCQS